MSYLANSSSGGDRHVYSAWQFPYGGQNSPPCLSITTRRWRYIRYPGGDEELYDMLIDSDNWRNLAGLSEYSDTLIEMRALLPGNVVEPATQLKDMELIIDKDGFYWEPRLHAE